MGVVRFALRKEKGRKIDIGNDKQFASAQSRAALV